MLAKLTSPNRLTLPKEVTAEVGITGYFDVTTKNGCIVLPPFGPTEPTASVQNSPNSICRRMMPLMRSHGPDHLDNAPHGPGYLSKQVAF